MEYSINSRFFAKQMADQLEHVISHRVKVKRRKANLEGEEVMPKAAELFFGCLILSNAIFSGFEVQWMSNNLGETTPLAFFIVRHTYTVLFCSELLVRMYLVGGCHKFLCATHDKSWSWLDFACVISSLLELIADVGMSMSKSSNGSGIFSNVRLTRVIRLTRVFRIGRTMRFVGALRQLVYSIAVTLKSLFWAMVLFLMIWYVFGLALTMETVEFLGQAQHENEAETVHPELKGNWGSLDSSMFALFMAISGGISWGELVEPLKTVSPFPVPLFCTYIAFTYFAVLNVVTAVFCTTAIENTQRNPEIVAAENLHRKRCMQEHLRTLFRAIDTDGSGYVTLSEIEQMSKDETALSWFEALDIDFRDAWTLFKLLDSQKEGAILVEDFLKGCEQLQGRASTIALAEMQYDMKKMSLRMRAMMDELKSQEPGKLKRGRTSRNLRRGLSCL